MKILEIVEAPVGNHLPASRVRQIEAVKMADQMWEQFRKLAGEDRGQLIDVTKPGESLPTLEELKTLGKLERLNKMYIVRSRIFPLLRELCNRTHAQFKYVPYWAYMGNGKVFFGWKYRKRMNVRLGTNNNKIK